MDRNFCSVAFTFIDNKKNLVDSPSFLAKDATLGIYILQVEKCPHMGEFKLNFMSKFL